MIYMIYIYDIYEKLDQNIEKQRKECFEGIKKYAKNY